MRFERVPPLEVELHRRQAEDNPRRRSITLDRELLNDAAREQEGRGQDERLGLGKDGAELPRRQYPSPTPGC